MHTPEPWTIDAEGWSDAADLIENHPRIVACVNACRGIPTESLTDGVVGRLVEAAKVIVDCAHWHPGVGHYVFSPNCGPVAAWREEGMIERLKAALAELSKEAANG